MVLRALTRCSPDKRDAKLEVGNISLGLLDDLDQLVLRLVNPALHLRKEIIRYRARKHRTSPILLWRVYCRAMTQSFNIWLSIEIKPNKNSSIYPRGEE